MILNEDYRSGQGNLSSVNSIARWVDSIDIAFDEADHSLFGSTGINAQDIFQG